MPAAKQPYRAHFVNHADEIFGVGHFEAEHDAAMYHGSQVFASCTGKGYEIWQGTRLVHKKTY